MNKLLINICRAQGLKKLRELASMRRLSHRDIVVYADKNTDIYSPSFLNSLPIINRLVKNKSAKITLKYINPNYFKEKIPLTNIKVLGIEPNNICNLSCDFCRTGRKERKPLPDLEFSFFKKIIDQFNPMPARVNLWGRGEPFLNRDILKMIAYLKDKGCPCVTISTNGHFLTKKNIAGLLESKLDKLLISLDSFHAKQYRRIRKGGNFKLVMNNLNILSKIIKQHNLRLKVYIQFIISRINEDEIAFMDKFCRQLGFKPEVRSISTDIRDMLPTAAEMRRNERGPNKNFDPVNCCPEPWDTMFISCEGKVTFCCKVMDSEYFDNYTESLVLGDFKNESLLKIWNGDKYKKLRRQMLSDKHKIGCPKYCPNPKFSLNDSIANNKSGVDNFY